MKLSRLFVAPVITFAVISPFSKADASTVQSNEPRHHVQHVDRQSHDVPTQQQQVAPNDATQTFVSKINDLRASVGVKPLTVDSTLSANAEKWASTMGSEARMYHQAMTPLSGFSARAENIAYGQSVDQIHEGLTNSPGHYENMTNPEYNKVGIGVVTGSDGNLYVAEEFGRSGR